MPAPPIRSHAAGLAPVFTARAPATAGELVQGWLDGQDFLINSPLDLMAEAEARPNPDGVVRILNAGDFSKARAAVQQLLLHHDTAQGVTIRFTRTIPRGKGMASSTAEISAALAAAAGLLGIRMSPAELSHHNIGQDPTDGTFFPGISRLNQLTGRLLRSYGRPPDLRFIVVDTGGSVSTEGFDRERARNVARRHQASLRQAVEFVRRGMRQKRAELIAAGATLSARINQEVLPKEIFRDLLAATVPAGALGVNCAHTGTVLGVMYDPAVAAGHVLLRQTAAIAGAESVIGDFAMISGGIR